jgi:hypothetical protein
MCTAEALLCIFCLFHLPGAQCGALHLLCTKKASCKTPIRLACKLVKRGNRGLAKWLGAPPFFGECAYNACVASLRLCVSFLRELLPCTMALAGCINLIVVVVHPQQERLAQSLACQILAPLEFVQLRGQRFIT